MGLIPDRFTAGTTFRLEAGPGIVLYLRGAGSITLNSQDGVLTAPPAETSTWTPGFYVWVLRRTGSAGSVSEIGSGTVDILPDIATIPTGTDLRSQNQRTYDAICAVIERRATLDQQSYKINNRELVRTPMADLLKLRARYARLVAQEKGQGGFREHRVHF